MGWIKIQSLEHKNEELSKTVSTQADSIKTLKESKEVTDLVLEQVGEKVESTHKTFTSLRFRLHNLEKSNEDIKNFLSLDVPSDIGGMLNNARTRKSIPTKSPELPIKESTGTRRSNP